MFFAGGASPREWGPARDILYISYSKFGPKPDPASKIPIFLTVGQARSTRFPSHLTSRLPGLTCDIHSQIYIYIFVFGLWLLLLE